MLRQEDALTTDESLHFAEELIPRDQRFSRPQIFDIGTPFTATA